MQMASCLGSCGPGILKPTLFKMSCFNVEAFQGVYWATHKSIYVCFLLHLLLFCLLSPFPAVLDWTTIMSATQTRSDGSRSHLSRWFQHFSQSMQSCSLWNHLVGIYECRSRRKKRKKEGRMEEWRIWKKWGKERRKRGKERRKEGREWVKEREWVNQQLEEIKFKGGDICDRV